ncbi:MAG: thioredoxin domain-containing protein, partial [Desulfobacterales bacterium]|nr:thioredoxin domain-containing protein [Desulfobacterales bacterium]
ALPSGNSVAALNFLRLSRMTGNVDLEKRAEQLTRAFATHITDHPMGCTQLLVALDFMVGPSKEIVIAGDPGLETTRAMVRVVHRKFLPNKVLLLLPQGAESNRIFSLSPFLETTVPSKPTVYVCEQYACQAPITDVDQLELALQ